MISILYFYRFCKHYFFAKNLHGTHSPFVFALLTNVIYKKTKFKFSEAIEFQRNKLLNNASIITINDLGAGSNVLITKKRSINAMAKSSLKSKKLAELLARLADHFQPQQIIELGTSFGITTAYLAQAAQKAKITTIEGCPEIAEIASSLFANLALNNIQLIVGNIDSVLKDVAKNSKALDFVYFDGNHTEEATLRYFYVCIPFSTASSVFVFDDIYWSTGMYNAWQKIKSNPNVTVTIDLFHIGLVFFKKDQAKEHFLIRV